METQGPKKQYKTREEPGASRVSGAHRFQRGIAGALFFLTESGESLVFGVKKGEKEKAGCPSIQRLECAEVNSPSSTGRGALLVAL